VRSAKSVGPVCALTVGRARGQVVEERDHAGGALRSAAAMRRIGTRLLIEPVRLAFAVPVAYAGAVVLQGPIETTCSPSEANPPGPSGLCSGFSGLSGAVLGFVGAIILSVFAERLWRRQRSSTKSVKPSRERGAVVLGAHCRLLTNSGEAKRVAIPGGDVSANLRDAPAYCRESLLIRSAEAAGAPAGRANSAPCSLWKSGSRVSGAPGSASRNLPGSLIAGA